MQYFVLQTPSLQHLAGVKMAALLWTQPDIFIQIAASFNNRPADELNGDEQEWIDIEEKVRIKSSALPLPETCKDVLSNFIKPIGNEIIVWCQYHHLDGYSFKFLENWLPRQFCWSMHGTIDYAKTANIMVKEERLSIERRFEFACLNCLEDEARELIEFLSKHRMHKYISEAVGYETLDRRIFLVYFACILSGDEDLLHRLFQTGILGDRGEIQSCLFMVAVSQSPRATCEYFFQKMNRENKDLVCFTLPFCRTQSPTCGLMYCLSLVNAEQQQLMFRPVCMSHLLQLLFRWPMQSLFVEAARRGWQFMNNRDCVELLSDVIHKIRDGFEDYDYAQLFWELWRLSPAEHQHHFLNDVEHLMDLFATEGEEFIQLIFNEAPSHSLRELIEDRYVNICYALLDDSIICDAALMEFKEKAALTSSNDEHNVEKRLRSEYVGLLVDFAMEDKSRMEDLMGIMMRS